MTAEQKRGIYEGDYVRIKSPSGNAGRHGLVTEVRVNQNGEWAKVKTSCCGTVLENVEHLTVVAEALKGL